MYLCYCMCSDVFNSHILIKSKSISYKNVCMYKIQKKNHKKKILIFCILGRNFSC